MEAEGTGPAREIQPSIIKGGASVAPRLFKLRQDVLRASKQLPLGEGVGLTVAGRSPPPELSQRPRPSEIGTTVMPRP